MIEGIQRSQSHDIYRGTCLRYLGYFSLLGKLVTPWNLRTLVNTITTTYILTDVVDKSSRMYNVNNSKCNSTIATGDAMIWQAFSSILIPSLLVKVFSERIRKLKVNQKFARYGGGKLPLILSIATLPILSGSIDKCVDLTLDYSYRKWLYGNTKICGDEHYASSATAVKKTPAQELAKYKAPNFDQIYDEMKNPERYNPDANKNSKNQPERDKPRKKRWCF